MQSVEIMQIVITFIFTVGAVLCVYFGRKQEGEEEKVAPILSDKEKKPRWTIWKISLLVCVLIAILNTGILILQLIAPDMDDFSLVPPTTAPTLTLTSTLPPVTPIPQPPTTAILSPTSIPVEAIFGQDGRVYLGDLMILDPLGKNLGCFGGGKISYAPTREYFLVVLDCFEGDNHAFLFRANGDDKRQITDEWDYVNYYDFEWALDGQSFTYQRINDCCVAPPPDAPPAGRIRYDVRTREKNLVSDTVTSSDIQVIFLRPSCGKTYYIQSGKTIELRYGAWGANGEERARDNARYLTVNLTIDGRPFNGQRLFVSSSFIPCDNIPSNSYWIQHTALIDSLAPGEYTVEVVFTFDQEITDGYDIDNDGQLDSYDTSTPIFQTYTIVVQ